MVVHRPGVIPGHRDIAADAIVGLIDAYMQLIPHNTGARNRISNHIHGSYIQWNDGVGFGHAPAGHCDDLAGPQHVVAQVEICQPVIRVTRVVGVVTKAGSAVVIPRSILVRIMDRRRDGRPIRPITARVQPMRIYTGFDGGVGRVPMDGGSISIIRPLAKVS